MYASPYNAFEPIRFSHNIALIYIRTQASNMAISARKFQFILEMLRKWSFSVNGQYALCDAPRCGICGTTIELCELLDCQRRGVGFGVRDSYFFDRSSIAMLLSIDEQQFWDN